MMKTKTKMVQQLFLVVAVIACSSSFLWLPSGTAAPAPSPAAVDCTTELFTLSDCLTYVTGNGSAAPTHECCTELASVVSTAPLCLCQLFNTTLVAQVGITINYTAADALPSACNVAAPSRSQCPGASAPSPSPSSSSSFSPVAPPSEPPITVYAPAPQAESEDCQAALFSLSDCLSYVTGNGSAPPTQTCCKELASVVDNEPICLCQLFNTTLVDQFGITINTTASLALPTVCNVSTPDPSLCSAIGIPVGSPSALGSPVASSPGVAASPPTSSLANVPSTSPSGNAAAPGSSSLVLITIAAAASTLAYLPVLLF